MKSSFYNLKAIVLISIVLLNCDNSSKEDKTITNETCEAELKELKQHLNSPFTFSQGIPEKFEFCNTNEAVLPKSDYNTITGIAKFSIPIPKGSNIKLMEKKKDTLFYECYGHDIVPYNDQDLIIENKTVSGLSRETQKRLWIRVTFKNFSDNNNCDAERSPLHEKVKQSEVLGEPFRQL